jgi:hypothetical protein
MQKTHEWGEYFPMTISPFAYNETRAPEYFPLSQKQVEAQGLLWREDTEAKSYKGPHFEIPDNISDVTDDIIGKVLVCEVTSRPYKIIEQELNFYKQHNISIPHFCPDQRHLDRMALRNPRRLYGRNCANCGTAIRTTYSPDRPEIVYCEACYLKTVY